MAHNIIHVRYVYMHNPGGQQAPAGQTYQLPPNSVLGVISATRPNPGGQSITHYKGAMGFPANNAGAVVYKEWLRLVKDELVARNFTPLANFAIGEFQQIFAGMRDCTLRAISSPQNQLRIPWLVCGRPIRQSFNLLRTV